MEKSESTQLVRQIGLGSGIAVIVGTTIGSGIFKSPSGIAEILPGPLPMLMVWIIGGLIVLSGALTLAEVGSAYPFSGGIYVYIREAFGRLPAFLFGWAQLFLIRPAGGGAIAVVFSQSLLRLLNITGITALEEGDKLYTPWMIGIAIVAIVTITIANIRGVNLATLIQNSTTVAKTAGLLVLIVVALAIGLAASNGGTGGGHFSPLILAGSFTLTNFGLGLVMVLWAYDGWADGSLLAGEIIDPRKNLPRAMIIGTIAIIGLYVLANIGYLAVMSSAEIGKSGLIAADTMSRVVGPWGVTFIAITIMVSTFGTLNGTLFTAPRIFYALAEDGLFFDHFSKVHPKFKTPYRSIALCGGLAVVYLFFAGALSGSDVFDSLTNAFVIGGVPFYALAVAAVFLFRGKEKNTKNYQPSVRTIGYPLTPIIFIASMAFLLVTSLGDSASRVPTAITLGIVLVGIPVFKILKLDRRS